MILGSGTLATAIRANVGEVDFTWLAWDLELGETTTFFTLARPVLRDLEFESLVVISSQVKVGTTKRLEGEFPGLWFAVVPENLRAASATEDFKSQDRVVVGARKFKPCAPLVTALTPFAEQFVYVSPESAEFSKHALNGFLALSITYANEIARLARAAGADPDAVAECLLTDSRIGRRAYLNPSGGLSPHLQREVANLIDLGGGDLIRACQ